MFFMMNLMKKICRQCNKQIKGKPIIYCDFYFCNEDCLDNFKEGIKLCPRHKGVLANYSEKCTCGFSKDSFVEDKNDQFSRLNMAKMSNGEILSHYKNLLRIEAQCFFKDNPPAKELSKDIWRIEEELKERMVR